MSNTHLWLAITILCFAFGCGSEDNGDSNAGAGGTAAGTTAGTTAATGGTTGGTTGATGGTTGGTTATGATGGTTGGTAATGDPNNCGGVVCTVPAGSTLTPCCNPMTNTCGMMGTFACLAVYEDPAPHMCPNETIMGVMVPGCCADGTLCGVVDLLLSGGCTERESIPALIATLPPLYCADGSPAPVTMGGDAGMP